MRRIRRVQIPERFIRRHARGKVVPTRVQPGEYSEANVRELQTMEGQDFDEEFYIVGFDTAELVNEALARTFI